MLIHVLLKIRYFNSEYVLQTIVVGKLAKKIREKECLNLNDIYSTRIEKTCAGNK